MAGSYLRKLLEEHNIEEVEVRSAGVMTVTGLRASQEAIQIMENEEVDLDRHRSSQLSVDMIHRADLILGMSPLHVQTALRMSDEARGKTFLMKEYARSDLKNIQISDPMGCTLEVFKKCFKEIKRTCEKLLETDFVSKGRKISKIAKPKVETPDEPEEVEDEPKVKKTEAVKPPPKAAERAATKKSGVTKKESGTTKKKSGKKSVAPKKKESAKRGAKSKAGKSTAKKKAKAGAKKAKPVKKKPVKRLRSQSAGKKTAARKKTKAKTGKSSRRVAGSGRKASKTARKRSPGTAPRSKARR